ncbi:unnamed protein product [Gadus morhua 'NCC']
MSLSAQMTLYQKDLALLPDTIKALQTTARDLLRRYASSPDAQRAARAFLALGPLGGHPGGGPGLPRLRTSGRTPRAFLA